MELLCFHHYRGLSRLGYYFIFLDTNLKMFWIRIPRMRNICTNMLLSSKMVGCYLISCPLNGWRKHVQSIRRFFQHLTLLFNQLHVETSGSSLSLETERELNNLYRLNSTCMFLFDPGDPHIGGFDLGDIDLES